jgi:hypothetical protein
VASPLKRTTGLASQQSNLTKSSRFRTKGAPCNFSNFLESSNIEDNQQHCRQM